MKKFLFILVLMLISFSVRVLAVKPEVCYVKTANMVYFGNDVKMGLFNTKIISCDGCVTKVKTSEITSYMHDGKLYDLLPLICPTGDTLCHAFLEYMTSRNGLKLYRFHCCENCIVKWVYFVYKDGNLYLRINQYNAESILPFFGIKNVAVC
jgi:hypothetical protein